MNYNDWQEWLKKTNLEIASQKRGPITLAELQEIATRMSVSLEQDATRAAPSLTILYSGNFRDTQSHKVANQLFDAYPDKVRIADRTEAVKILYEEDFNEEIKKALVYDAVQKGQAIDEYKLGGMVDEVLWGKRGEGGWSLGMIDEISARFIRESNGTLSSLTATSGHDSVFARTENFAVIDALLANENVPSVDGIPRQLLLDRYEASQTLALRAGETAEAARTKAVKDIGDMIRARSYLNLIQSGSVIAKVDGEYIVHVTDDYFKRCGAPSLNALPFSGLTDFTTGKQLFGPLDESLTALSRGAKSLVRHTGPVADGLMAVVAWTTAESLWKANRKSEALETLLGYVGGLAGGTLAVELLTTPAAAVTLTGPWGAVGAAVLLVTGGIAGSMAGEQAVKTVMAQLDMIGAFNTDGGTNLSEFIRSGSQEAQELVTSLIGYGQQLGQQLRNFGQELVHQAQGSLGQLLGDIATLVKTEGFGAMSRAAEFGRNLLDPNKFPLGVPWLPSLLPFLDPLRDRLQQADRWRLRDPLVLDLDADGVETLAPGSGKYFDHDNNNFAEETAWVGPDDGLLVWDNNGNGTIDSGAEIFGENTLLPATGQRIANGFEALSRLDLNHDGQINESDPTWSNLAIWQDKNSNTRLEEGELMTLQKLQIKQLNLNYNQTNNIDTKGILHELTGHYTLNNGNILAMEDLWFPTDSGKTRQSQFRSADFLIANLPNLAGMGNVASLHYAMQTDSSGKLKQLVTDWLAANAEHKSQITPELIYNWTGVQNAKSDTQPALKDARTLMALEALFGTKFMNNNGIPDDLAGRSIQLIFDEVCHLVEILLASEKILNPLLGILQPYWDGLSHKLQWDAEQAAQLLLNDGFGAGDPQTWIPKRVALLAMGVDAPELLEAISREVQHDGSATYLNLLYLNDAPMNLGSNDSELLQGTGDRDLLVAEAGNDTLDAGSGHDILSGGLGNDLLLAGTGNDTLWGGSGDDSLDGNNGQDTYLFGRGFGRDTITDLDFYDSLDQVQFLDLETTDLQLLQRQQNNLIFSFASGDQLTLNRFFETFWAPSWSGTPYAVESFQFADHITWGWQDIAQRVLITGASNNNDVLGCQDTPARVDGLAGDDQLHGGEYNDSLSGNLGNDFLLSRGGDDSLAGGEGNDTLDAGYGHDILSGGLGNDLLLAGTGNDTLWGGSGDDSLDGNNGQDTYLFGRGFGHDTITDLDFYDSLDQVQFLDLETTDLQLLQRQQNNLIFSFASGDQLTLNRFFETFWAPSWSGTPYAVESFQFADHITWGWQDIAQRVLITGASNNNDVLGCQDTPARVDGLAGDDQLHGGEYNDSLSGNLGNDFLLSRGGDDSLAGGEGNDTLDAGYGHDILSGGLGNDLLLAGTGNDTLWGGSGDDSLDGNNGQDTYLFGRGFGHDTITDLDFYDSLDQVQFLDLETTDLQLLQRQQNNLIFSFASGDQLTLNRFFETFWAPSWSGTPYAVESFQFADHISWGWQEINQKIDSYQAQGLINPENAEATTHELEAQDEWDPITGYNPFTEEMTMEEFNSAIPILREMTWNLQKSLEDKWGLPVHGMAVWENFSQGAELFGIHIHWEGLNAATSNLGSQGPL